MKARCHVRAALGEGGTVLEELRREAPLGLFAGRAPAPGWAQVWLVGSAGGPLGGDDVELHVAVAEGAALAVGSVAASLALSGTEPSRTVVRAVVERGAALVWAPEPLVVTGGADHRMEVTIDAAGGASVWWRDELVLGRTGERPGRCTVLLHADLGGAPWVRHELAIGAPGWDSGAVVGDRHIIGSVLMTARGPEGLHPQAGGTLSVAVADDRLSLQRLLPTPTFPRRSAHAPSAVNA